MYDIELSWWRLHSDQYQVPKNSCFVNPVGITINSANRREALLIKEWCKNNNVFVKSASYFNDCVRYKRMDGNECKFYYINNERLAICELKTAKKLERWLASLPVRCYSSLLENIDRRSVVKLVRGYSNTRILSDIYDNQKYLVSFDDSNLKVELKLREE